jgi:hypothetical protein
MKNLTICLPFYSNRGMLQEQCRRFRAMPDELKARLRLIVVDDGTQINFPNETAIWEDIGFPFELYRMLVDVRWNQDACRNLAVNHATTEWVLLTDMDHIAPRETLAAVLDAKLDPSKAYRFERMTLHGTDAHGADDLSPYKPHPNSWLMTRDAYWKMGGYDELLAGYYGSDGDFRHRVNAVLGQPIDLPFPLYRVPRETIPDASTTTYERKAKIDGELKTVLQKRNNTPGWQPVHFRFPSERVTFCKVCGLTGQHKLDCPNSGKGPTLHATGSLPGSV